MSNIYDSANELSRGLRGLPEYKAVKAAKDAIAADAEASKIFTEYLAFQ
ncbi:3-phosphoshikimate 1-carboxyvinyltransferase [Streptococcus pneumoniae]|nr:3-phosphoshikimate 1-carboxyvinyltransferase [Streptococcus pneumoniae]